MLLLVPVIFTDEVNVPGVVLLKVTSWLVSSTPKIVAADAAAGSSNAAQASNDDLIMTATPSVVVGRSSGRKDYRAALAIDQTALD
ncbi:hypothetical protein [uncultured Sphingomonas sp.]|uniref:hypothetical protein n=1 Tax=uncultured Sphingomonas sp. TaxID=158754 RepID=UPI0030F50504